MRSDLWKDLALTVRRAHAAAFEYAAERNFAGPDPYDGLTSERVRVSGRVAQRIVLQGVKRSPVDLRRVLGIPPVRMAKSLALVIAGLHGAEWIDRSTAVSDVLADELIGARYGPAWGYEFDVRTRWGTYNAGTPNVIVTAFAVEALHCLGRLRQVESAFEWLVDEMVHPAGYLRYAPGNDALIHNANILGARAVARFDPDHPVVGRAVEQTLSRQRGDGLWPYGTGDNLSWVDNFHTAYVILGLADLVATRPSISPYLDLAVDGWLENCFLSTGQPRYYAGKDGRVDVHNIATAVFALARLGARDPACWNIMPAAAGCLLELQGPDGGFRSTPHRPAFMRWNQGHALLALRGVAYAAMENATASASKRTAQGRP